MTRDEMEEIEQDTTMIRLSQTPVNVHTREVYEGEGIKQTGQLFVQQRETEVVLSVDQLQKQMEDLGDKDVKYQLACMWFTAKLDKAQEDLKQFVTAWDLVQKIKGFQTKKKQDKELQNSVQGIWKQHFNTEKWMEGNQEIIR